MPSSPIFFFSQPGFITCRGPTGSHSTLSAGALGLRPPRAGASSLMSLRLTAMPDASSPSPERIDFTSISALAAGAAVAEPVAATVAVAAAVDEAAAVALLVAVPEAAAEPELAPPALSPQPARLSPSTTDENQTFWNQPFMTFSFRGGTCPTEQAHRDVRHRRPRGQL
jgi:hypothetical protein